MHIPHFPERQHPIIQSLFHHTDQDLLTLFQRHPDEGRYFVSMFCRYHSMVYTLIQHAVRSPVQAEYLFAMTWRHVYHELRGLDLTQFTMADPSKGNGKKSTFSLQTWLINITAVCVNHAKLPPVESIHYTLAEASPPLWCYIDQALTQLLPLHRLTILMAQTFHWSTTRISAYLRAEGTTLAEEEVEQVLSQGYQSLCNALPDDIKQIYGLTDKPEQAFGLAVESVAVSP